MQIKQQDILKAALPLFVELGFHGTPTSRIAKEAGVANGTLFHYYKTKDDLIVALYIQVKSELAEAMYRDMNPAAGIRQVMKTIYGNTLLWAEAHREAFYFMQQFNTSPYLSLIAPEEIRRQAKPHLTLLESAINDQVFKKIPVELMYILVNNHIYGVSQFMHQHADSPEEKQKMIDTSFDMLWNMLQ